MANHAGLEVHHCDSNERPVFESATVTLWNQRPGTLETRSFTSNYRITITFDTKLTQSEYDDIAKLRHDLIAKRTAGLKPSMEYYEANGQAQGVIQLPDYYMDRFTVYFYYSDKDSIFELRPDSVKSTRDKITKNLESSCSKYVTASGQNGEASASRPVHPQTN